LFDGLVDYDLLLLKVQHRMQFKCGADRVEYANTGRPKGAILSKTVGRD
jgi:hypothetical protein